VAVDVDDPQKELILTVEEAYALLAMCLASPLEFDVDSLSAVDKLTEYCIRLDQAESLTVRVLGEVQKLEAPG
jgi:hypothetical protein